MKNTATTILIAACALFTGASASFNAMAQSEVSALSAVSAMPLASVVVAGSAAVALPIVLSTAGATGTVYVLERASDGARVCVQVLSSGAVAA